MAALQNLAEMADRRTVYPKPPHTPLPPHLWPRNLMARLTVPSPAPKCEQQVHPGKENISVGSPNPKSPLMRATPPTEEHLPRVSPAPKRSHAQVTNPAPEAPLEALSVPTEAVRLVPSPLPALEHVVAPEEPVAKVENAQEEEVPEEDPENEFRGDASVKLPFEWSDEFNHRVISEVFVAFSMAEGTMTLQECVETAQKKVRKFAKIRAVDLVAQFRALVARHQHFIKHSVRSFARKLPSTQEREEGGEEEEEDDKFHHRRIWFDDDDERLVEHVAVAMENMKQDDFKRMSLFEELQQTIPEYHNKTPAALCAHFNLLERTKAHGAHELNIPRGSRGRPKYRVMRKKAKNAVSRGETLANDNLDGSDGEHSDGNDSSSDYIAD